MFCATGRYKSGVSTHAISKWERGVARPTYRPLKKVAEALGIPPEQLLAGGPLAPDDWPPDDYEEGVRFANSLIDGA